MKWLELAYGSINLEAVSCVEATIEEGNTNLYVCRFYTDHKDMVIFSFEAKEDARIFRKHFWKRILSFLHDSDEYFAALRDIIQEALHDAEKEWGCKR